MLVTVAEDTDASKGFVISFDDDGPKKPKPALKARRLSSKKNSLAGQSEMSSDGSNSSRKENVPPHDDIMICIDMNTGDESAGSNDMRTYRKPRNGGLDHWKSYDHEPLSSDQELSASNSTPIPKFEVDPEVPLETMVALDQSDSQESDEIHGNKALIIGDDLVRKDPGVQDEMQRKKERIMMQSLRRKQQAEENRIRKLEEEKRKKEDEAKKEEERDFKKQEEKARREAILEQHKLKKAMDKAEEEVKIWRDFLIDWYVSFTPDCYWFSSDCSFRDCECQSPSVQNPCQNCELKVPVNHPVDLDLKPSTLIKMQM